LQADLNELSETIEILTRHQKDSNLEESIDGIYACDHNHHAHHYLKDIHM
jgi:hypothetical protein